MSSKIVVISGRPGVGKTTVFNRVLDMVRSHGLSVGGIVCPEVRERSVRIGFKVVDLMNYREGWLARVSKDCPPKLRVGKYCVNVDDVISVGVNALKASVNADLVGIDEIGPMELRVIQLRAEMINVLKRAKRVLAVVHWRLSDAEFIELLRTATRYKVTVYNREVLPSKIFYTLVN